MNQAHRIAEDHGLFYIPVSEPIRDGFRRAWVVYRKNPNGPHIRLGRRSTTSALLSLVKVAAGVAAQPPTPTEKETAF